MIFMAGPKTNQFAPVLIYKVQLFLAFTKNSIYCVCLKISHGNPKTAGILLPFCLDEKWKDEGNKILCGFPPN